MPTETTDLRDGSPPPERAEPRTAGAPAPGRAHEALGLGRVRLFGVDIDPVRLDEAVRWILRAAREPGLCRYVVTPNLDHSLQLRQNRALRNAYADAALVIADGWPVVLASRLFGPALPARVTGSDVVPAILRGATREEPLRIFLLGAMEGVAARAARRVEALHAGIEVVGTRSPPFGFERDARENERILEHIAEAQPHVLVVGFGAPKQELWVHAHLPKIAANVALCAGATIDFLAGERSRAPAWVQTVGAEWLHRMMTEPRRLAPRYFKNAIGFPTLLFDEWRERRELRR
jgi:N-acetylglucosaminyldiphosphoundecaprenol N-acetyl-beta-D-mannosaminyltransferase